MRTLIHKRLKYALVLSSALAVTMITAMVWVSHATSSYDAETTAGLTLNFYVRLPYAPNNWAARYSYKTVDGTATEGEDYNAVSGKVVFNSGEQVKTISVQTLSNNQNNVGTETVKLKLYDLQTNGLFVVAGWYTSPVTIGWIPDEMTLTGAINTGSRKFGE